MLEIKEVNDKKQWTNFLSKKEIIYYPLFQSWNWGEVQKALGFSIIRIGLFDNDKLVAVCLIIDIIAKRGHYLHLRHGPVILDKNIVYINAIVNYVKKIAKEKKAKFIRMSPLWEKKIVDIKYLKNNGCIDAPIYNMDAEYCWVLDISKSEKELLSDMRKSHRYLIRKSLKMHIEISKTNDVKAVDDFLLLYKDLSDRKHFVPHRGIREEVMFFGQDNEALLLLASWNNEIAGGAVIDFVGKMAIYHHGATLSRYRDIPLSYIIQWQAILEAKKRGMKIYNFWGIAPLNQPNHPWQGHTLFKMGFGGEVCEFVHAQDIPLSLDYWRSWIIEKITKKLKGY